jgi:hypothetical protein
LQFQIGPATNTGGGLRTGPRSAREGPHLFATSPTAVLKEKGDTDNLTT